MVEHIDWYDMVLAKDLLFKECELQGFKKEFSIEEKRSFRACFVSESGKTRINLKIAPVNSTLTWVYVNGKEQKKIYKTHDIALIRQFNG